MVSNAIVYVLMLIAEGEVMFVWMARTGFHVYEWWSEAAYSSETLVQTYWLSVFDGFVVLWLMSG